MISVEFQSVSAGTCAWCKKEKSEIFAIAFSDKSFVGPLCKSDLMRAISMKLGTPQEKSAATSSPSATDNGAR